MPHGSRTPTKHLAPCRCSAMGFLSLLTPHGSSTPSNNTPQTTTSPTERHLSRHPQRICSTEVHRPPRPQSPLPNTSRCNIPEETPPLRPHSHRPRPPRPRQKQSNHTFPVSGSRGCVCLSYGSRECVMRLKPYGRNHGKAEVRFTKARRHCRNALNHLISILFLNNHSK